MIGNLFLALGLTTCVGLMPFGGDDFTNANFASKDTTINISSTLGNTPVNFITQNTEQFDDGHFFYIYEVGDEGGISTQVSTTLGVGNTAGYASYLFSEHPNAVFILDLYCGNGSYYFCPYWRIFSFAGLNYSYNDVFLFSLEGYNGCEISAYRLCGAADTWGTSTATFALDTNYQYYFKDNKFVNGNLPFNYNSNQYVVLGGGLLIAFITNRVGYFQFRMATACVDFNTLDYDYIYHQGYSAGEKSGYDKGEAEGYHNGYIDGQNAGMQISQTSFMSLFASIVDTPMRMLYSLFNFDLFGTSMLIIILSTLTAIVVIKILKKFI